MNRKQSTALVISIFVLVTSVGSVLFSLTFRYPTPDTQPKSDSFYDTSFWNFSNVTVDPFDLELVTEQISDYSHNGTTVELNTTKFTFRSEVYKETEIRINSYIIQRTDLSGPVAAILLLHGYGSNIQELLPMIRNLAAAGYIVMGTDSPGSGESTKFPQLNPYTFLDVSDGPESAHIYHSVWAAARALTILSDQPFTDTLIVGGASMGGMETVMLSAIDDRVDGSISMISGGNLFESMKEGSLINSLINPDYEIGSEELDLLQRWFDPIAYYRELTKPLFMIFGTSDPFFVLSGFMQTIDEITAPLTLSIRPSHAHVVDTTWSNVIDRWVSSEFLGEDAYPVIESVSASQNLTLAGWTLQVRATTSIPTTMFVCWRTGNPGATWMVTPMTLVDGEYIAELTPLIPSQITYFVYSEEAGTFLMSSGIETGGGGSYLIFLVILASTISVFWLARETGWRVTQDGIIGESPILIGVLMMGAGLILPFYGIKGRTEISLLEFIEVHGYSLGLSGWFLSLALFILYYIIASAAVRRQFEFRVVVVVWFPMLVLVTIAHIFLAGVFAISGGLNEIYTGIGAFLMIFAVPVMLVLESIICNTTDEEEKEIISKVLESQDA